MSNQLNDKQKCSFKEKRDELLKKLEEKDKEIDKLYQKKLDMGKEEDKLEDERDELEEEAHTLVDLIEGKDGEELRRERDEIGKGVFKNNMILRTDIWDWKQKVLNYQSNEDKN